MSDTSDEASHEGEAKGGLPPLTKKILSLGLGAFFLGEDYVRRAVKEAKLPRDIGKSIAVNASKGKEELFGFVARELSGFLRQMDIQAELSRFASTHKIRVTTEIEFLPRGPGEPAVESVKLGEVPRGEPGNPQGSGSSDQGKPLPVDDPGEWPEGELSRSPAAT